jgi:DNA-binding transcriptional MocR family regulator
VPRRAPAGGWISHCILQLRKSWRRIRPKLLAVGRKDKARRGGIAIHIGSFSKTLSPTLRLGFVIVPPGLVSRFDEAVAYLAFAPEPAVQMATAEFMRDGHYMRHLRRMKRIYAARSDALLARSVPGDYTPIPQALP